MSSFRCIASYLLLHIIFSAQCHDVNISTSQSLQSQYFYDYDNIMDTALDISEYKLYFESYHFVWNNHDEWNWKSSYNNSVNETIACTKQKQSLCMSTEFRTNNKTQIQSLKSLTIHYKDDKVRSNNIELDFFNDLDWSQLNILHHHDPNRHIDRRQLLNGAFSSKYDYKNGEQELESLQLNAQQQFEDDDISSIDTMEEMNDFIFNEDDNIEDIYNYDDYYKYYERMSAEEWGVFKKLAKGVGGMVTAIGNRLGIYRRPPCKSNSRCQVHFYRKNDFKGGRINKKGHFCEGKWGRWRLHKYRINTNEVSSAAVQGSPCCVLIAYNGYKYNGDYQSMYPRGRYASMRDGIPTGMGTKNGMNGLRHGFLGMHIRSKGFPDRRMGSMKIVHNCRLRKILMHRARRSGKAHPMSGGMMGGMGMGTNMIQMMQMQMQMEMLMDMILPDSDLPQNKPCTAYSCVTMGKQNQLTHKLLQMMFMPGANTKANRRRIMKQKMHDTHVIGIRKCKMLYFTEICVTFDSIDNVITVDYTMKHKKERQVQLEDNVSDAWGKIDSLLRLFDDMMDVNITVEEDDVDDDDDVDDQDLRDIDDWIDNDSLDVFMDYVGVDVQVSKFVNRYYDEMILDEKPKAKRQDKVWSEFGYSDDVLAQMEMQHQLELFVGTFRYSMLRNELIFADDFGYDLEYAHLDIEPDNDMLSYFDTFVLESKNNDDWKSKLNTTTKCNDVILSFLSYSICVNQMGIIYFHKNDIDLHDLYDEGRKVFYERTQYRIAQELDNIKLDIMNDTDWTEIFDINQGMNTSQKKVCNYIAMMQLCVERQVDTLLHNFKISIQYLSDQRNKQMMRQNREIFDEWLKWSEFF